MDHIELKKDITHRIDRLEDDIRTQLDGLEFKLDELGNKMIQSSTANSVRIESMSGQIKLIWTAILTIISGAATYLLNQIK
jgi:hypothetical protein